MTKVYYYLKRTQAIAKEEEYDVPTELRAKKDIIVEKLFPLTISLMGNISRKIINNELLEEDRKMKQLEVISKYFTAYYNSGGAPEYSNYLLLLSAISYYFLGQYGTSNILASKIKENDLIKYSDFAVLNSQVLRNELIGLKDINECWNKELCEYIEMYKSAIRSENGIDSDKQIQLRKVIFNYGSDRDVLFVEIFLALTKLKCENSCFKLLKEYSGLNAEKIARMVDSRKMINEMWPAQKLMAEKGFFNGSSGIVQLPTGAGKTKSIALCVYTFKETNEIGTSVVVTPFRALTREVRRDLSVALSFDDEISVIEVSDLMQEDYFQDIFSEQHYHKVIVLTPEKLLYIIEREPEFIKDIGQIIFDEGHLFEDEHRGTKFELLVSNILANTNKDAQKILISAMVGGVSSLNSWVSDNEGSIVTEEQFYPAEKNIVALRRSKQELNTFFDFVFLNPKDINNMDYYVPRIVQGKLLNNGECFPSKGNDYSIATLLRLVGKDNCAIFGGTKPIVNSILKRFCELDESGINVSALTNRNDENEQNRICYLIKQNYGDDDLLVKAANIGIFAHHSAITDGIKSSIEYALQKSLITNVVCTSTLAQGVNIPIKYLIISNTYQGGSPMESRDFLNLVGRVGRPGMYIDGTIIYSNPDSYYRKDYPWKLFKSLFSTDKENCYSTLEILCKRGSLYEEGIVDCFYTAILELYRSDKKSKDDIRKYYVKLDDREGKGEQRWRDTWDYVIEVLGNIEWYLARYDSSKEIQEITHYTLVRKIISEEEVKCLNAVFYEIRKYIDRVYDDPNKRILFSKSLLPSDEFIRIHADVDEMFFSEGLSKEELFVWIITRLSMYEEKKMLQRMSIEVACEIAELWIKGNTYQQILSYCNDNDYKILKRKRRGSFSIDEIINICTGCFGYSSTIILNAISDYVRQDDSMEDWADEIDLIGQKLKYGLPNKEMVYIYELGFNDRTICMEIYQKLGICLANKEEIRSRIINNKEEIANIMMKYPSYYSEVLNRI